MLPSFPSPTLLQTAEDVAELKIDVQRAMSKAEEEVKNTDALVAVMSKQRAEAELEKEGAARVAERASAASAAAAIVEKEAEKELLEAKPALERAKAAVAGLDKASLTELKNFNKPPKGVEKVTACCLMMLEVRRCLSGCSRGVHPSSRAFAQPLMLFAPPLSSSLGRASSRTRRSGSVPRR
jgi:hypothetical protein